VAMCRGTNGLKRGSEHSVHVHWLRVNAAFWRLLGKSALIYSWNPGSPSPMTPVVANVGVSCGLPCSNLWLCCLGIWHGFLPPTTEVTGEARAHCLMEKNTELDSISWLYNSE